jgi:hypothetical protein
VLSLRGCRSLGSAIPAVPASTLRIGRGKFTAPSVSRRSTHFVTQPLTDRRQGGELSDTVRAVSCGEAPALTSRFLRPELILRCRIRGHPATKGRFGVIVVLCVKPTPNELCSQAGRPMQQQVDDARPSKVGIATQTSLELTLEHRVGLIGRAVHLPQLSDLPLPLTPLALLGVARPGKPCLASLLLKLRPFFYFLVRWLSGHKPNPFCSSLATRVVTIRCVLAMDTPPDIGGRLSHQSATLKVRQWSPGLARCLMPLRSRAAFAPDLLGPSAQ